MGHHPECCLCDSPEVNTDPLRAQFFVNSNTVNMLFAAVGDAEFQRVSHLSMAREIWTTLAEHHEGTAQVKARLFQAHRREYENFTQKPGESVEDLFGRF